MNPGEYQTTAARRQAVSYHAPHARRKHRRDSQHAERISEILPGLLLQFADDDGEEGHTSGMVKWLNG